MEGELRREEPEIFGQKLCGQGDQLQMFGKVQHGSAARALSVHAHARMRETEPSRCREKERPGSLWREREEGEFEPILPL